MYRESERAAKARSDDEHLMVLKVCGRAGLASTYFSFRLAADRRVQRWEVGTNYLVLARR
jgi:hypothetical protein